MKDPIEALKEYIHFPSVSADSSYKDGLDGARDYACGLLKDLGFEVEIVETPLHPIILAERGGDPSWPHVVIYGHYDVQPADPFELWTSPAFKAEVRDGRIYGRGAADNKGPTIVHMAALANVLKENPDLPLRITYLIEGEEEIGSPSFQGFLKDYKERLSQADFVLVSDTGIPTADQIVITTGLRGMLCFEIELTGPSQDLHSGVHGGAILNPIQALSELCASLHTPDGRVNIPGFYDDVVGVEDWEREELKRYPLTEDKYKKFLGVKEFYSAEGYSPLEAIKFGPTLEFNGITGGYQGEGSKTVIASKASAKISCRLVSNQKGEEIFKLIEKTLMERCPPQVELKITAHGAPGSPYCVVPPGRSNTPADQSPVLANAFGVADEAITEVFGNKPIYLREGGSVPIITDLKEYVGLDSLMIGLFMPEDNLHAPDESFNLEVMENAIKAFEKIITNIAKK